MNSSPGHPNLGLVPYPLPPYALSPTMSENTLRLNSLGSNICRLEARKKAHSTMRKIFASLVLNDNEQLSTFDVPGFALTEHDALAKIMMENMHEKHLSAVMKHSKIMAELEVAILELERDGKFMEERNSYENKKKKQLTEAYKEVDHQIFGSYLRELFELEVGQVKQQSAEDFLRKMNEAKDITILPRSLTNWIGNQLRNHRERLPEINKLVNSIQITIEREESSRHAATQASPLIPTDKAVPVTSTDLSHSTAWFTFDPTATAYPVNEQAGDSPCSTSEIRTTFAGELAGVVKRLGAGIIGRKLFDRQKRVEDDNEVMDNISYSTTINQVHAGSGQDSFEQDKLETKFAYPQNSTTTSAPGDSEAAQEELQELGNTFSNLTLFQDRYLEKLDPFPSTMQPNLTDKVQDSAQRFAFTLIKLEQALHNLLMDFEKYLQALRHVQERAIDERSMQLELDASITVLRICKLILSESAVKSNDATRELGQVAEQPNSEPSLTNRNMPVPLKTEPEDFEDMMRRTRKEDADKATNRQELMKSKYSLAIDSQPHEDVSIQDQDQPQDWITELGQLHQMRTDVTYQDSIEKLEVMKRDIQTTYRRSPHDLAASQAAISDPRTPDSLKTYGDSIVDQTLHRPNKLWTLNDWEVVTSRHTPPTPTFKTSKGLETLEQIDHRIVEEERVKEIKNTKEMLEDIDCWADEWKDYYHVGGGDVSE